MKKILVTGATGFLGSHIFEKFNENGYVVQGWDIVTNVSILKDIRWVDMNSKDAICAALAEFEPDIVIHCAGAADVGKSVQNPENDFAGNVALTHNLLFAIHKLNMDKVKFVFLSSAGVYGNPESLPIVEDMELNPLSPYALHKVMCEDVCRYFAKNYGMCVKIARIFSAYGKGLKKQIFWDMYNKAIATDRLDMFGTGNESRDYIHVKDVCQAIFLIATKDSDEIVYNVANGEEVTIAEAARCFAVNADMSLDKIKFNGQGREGDPVNWRADITKLKALGYEKTVDMSQGLAEYIEWLRA